MDIAVNMRLLIKNKLEGIGWFTYESFIRITKQHPEHHFYFIFDRPFHPDYLFSKNVTPIILSPQARHPFLFYIWFEWSLPSLLNKLKPDLFVSPDGYLSLKSKVRSLAVIHDLNFEHYPEDLPWLIRKYYCYFFPRFALKADRIATVSEFSKQDIIRQYQIPADKIDIVYDGSSELYIPLKETEIREIRLKYTMGAPYFVFVGALHPRKNLANLFLAFDEFKKQKSTDVKMVIVGEKKWWTKEIRKAYGNMEYSGEVIFCGRQKLEELRKILGAALALTYVSYFEGFGIPIVEAFRCGVPVITSNVTSMPEVAGDAALLIDPFDPSSISEAMVKINEDTELRAKLIQNGTRRKEEFNWQRTADLLWDSIEKSIYKNELSTPHIGGESQVEGS
jgi:glycosyltransferase involved in cell wall biosynthesis